MTETIQQGKPQEKRKKKIVMTTDTFFPKKDGVTRFLEGIVPEISHKYDILILAPSYTGKKTFEKFHGADVIRFPVSSLFSIAGYEAVKVIPASVKQYIKDTDLVWVNSASSLGASAIFAGKKLGKPVIAYVHSLEWEQLTHIVMKYAALKKTLFYIFSRFGRYLYNKCDLLMVSSKTVADEITDKGITAKKIIVPLGVECDKFIPPEDKEKAKRNLSIDPKKIVIGYCGRISTEKDVKTLSKAFKKLQERNLNIFLLIIGDGNKEDVKKYIKNNYRITGFVENVIPYLQALDIFVMPSLTETTSLATLEAMSCGIVPIATKVGYIQEYIENGFNGYSFPKQNVDVLYAKLEHLLKNPDVREKVSAMARKTITTKHNWEKTIVQIHKVLERF